MEMEQAPDASALGAKQLLEEMESRGFRDTNFREDNVRILQQAFDVEWEHQRQEFQKRQREMLERKKQEEEQYRKRRMVERQRAEEAEAVKGDERVKTLLLLVRTNKTPADVTLRVDPVATRALVKAVGDNTSLLGLDLTRANLRDDVGVELARSLQRNVTLRRLDLDGNNFGPMTVAALAEALQQNTTLSSLSLEGNPLTNEGTNFYGIEALSSMLGRNTTLTSLNLFGCGLGADGGRALSAGMKSNSTLLRLQLAPTDDIELADLASISESLTRNKNAVEAAAAAEEADRRAKRVTTREERHATAAATKDRDETSWIESQKAMRAAERRAREIEAKKKEEEDRVAREVAEAARLEEIRRAKEEAAKKKKKKGKKKK